VKKKEGKAMKITMAHGSGGRATSELIDEIFAKEFDNEVLSQMEDSAVVDGSEKIALTTDSFVVTPIEFPGGDIGRLCICGTVNDLLMRGAVPRYITCGFILQEGADTDQLKRIVHSMAETAKEAGVCIVAGDTKVVEGNGGIFINTAGVGFVPADINIAAANSKPGDVVIVSGELGDHHAAILSSRMEIENSIVSDNAPLRDIVMNLIDAGIELHVLRDVTRGGLATVLKELSDAAGCCIELDEEKLPVNAQVRDFCGLLGLDPLYMGNEGKLIAIVPEAEAEATLQIMHNSKYGEHAAVVGRVLAMESLEGANVDAAGKLVVKTALGGHRILDVLQGEGLPRIC
jgi:hydrogenase expression/formation protein HypE